MTVNKVGIFKFLMALETIKCEGCLNISEWLCFKSLNHNYAKVKYSS